MKLEPTVSVRPPRPKDKDTMKPEPENKVDLWNLSRTDQQEQTEE